MSTISGATLILPSGSITNQDIAGSAAIDITKLAQSPLAVFPVLFSDCKTWDAWHTTLPMTPATDDLGIVTGTFGSDYLTIQTGDLKSAGSTSRKVGFEVAVPANYHDGETVQLRIRAAMETTIADTAATVDLQVYAPDGAGAVGSDLCTTAAQSANSLTPANLDFMIDATAVDPGDRLQCVVTFLVNDAATGTVVTGAIYNMQLMCDTRG